MMSYQCANNLNHTLKGSENRRIGKGTKASLNSQRCKLYHHSQQSLHRSNRSRSITRSRPRHITAEARASCDSISPPRRAHAPSLHSSSDPIRLPESHIHRTPSELQLAQELIKADFRDERMYTRLVNGMLLHYDDDEHSMHPLTVKSLKGLMSTHRRGISCQGFEQGQVPSSELDCEISFLWEDSMTWVDGTDFDDESKAISGARSLSNSDEEEDDCCIFSLEI
ncbi:hypothetical protein HJC23_008880 [Cyclotella cryptica]|uniref:Uncharacterized protein n=1 Tax=Cyclotella cryptica TaxID=29204 RepID=A0ABD3PDG5_9STRA|eukprot:CCRYP_015977-RA/>CCRYP_015977-RA protein AED:0.33 eAED:0.33 QI:0/-1/0/1/-1/1/1/0/224